MCNRVRRKYVTRMSEKRMEILKAEAIARALKTGTIARALEAGAKKLTIQYLGKNGEPHMESIILRNVKSPIPPEPKPK